MKAPARSFPALVSFLLLAIACCTAQTAPSITSISPTVGQVSPVGGPVTIKGTNFGSVQGTSTVSIGGLAVTPASWSSTKIVVPVPGSLNVGFADVAVTVNGLISNALSFLVIPVITRDSPASGTVGTTITLTGTSFGDSQGTSTVMFNGVPVAPTSWSNTSIALIVPAGAANGMIVATINGFSTNGVQFLVLPSITSLSPAVASPGAVVAVSGSAFGKIQGFGSVTFNGVTAPVQNWSDTSISVVVPAGATTGNVIVTTGSLLTSSGVSFPVISPLVIQAITDRPSNGGGWYQAPVTVTFQCSGGLPPVACPAPQTVATDGANQVIQGTAADSAGSVASASVTVNLDQAAPAITIGAPASGGTVTRPVLRITGSASDSISGVAAVACNGISATVVSDGSFICNLTLTSGSNSIQALATDNAGNTTASSPISVVFSPVAPSAVFITPAAANMVVGDSRFVRLVGDQGQPVTGATWTVSDSTLLAITTSDPPQLSALAAGTTTLTASFGLLNSTMTVNISAGPLAFGTPLWVVEPTPGNTINTIMRANPINEGDPDIYMIDGATTLRAFTADGQQLWNVQVDDTSNAGSPAAPTLQTAAVSSRPAATPLTPAALATLKENLRNRKIPEPQERLLTLRQTANLRAGSAPRTVIRSETLAPLTGSVASAGPLLVRQTVPDNSGGAINLVVNCQDPNCVTAFTPTLTRVDNASQQQIWTHTFNDGPFLSLSALAIGPDDTIYQSGVFVVSTDPVTGLEDTRAEFAAVDGTTGLLKFSVPLPTDHTHFVQLDTLGNVLTDETSESAAAVGPIAVMPDGSVRALVSSAQLSNTQSLGGPGSVCNPGSFSCDIAISDHKALQLLVVQPDGSFTFQAVKNFDFDTSGCAPLCNDPGFSTSFAPEEVIPDGLGGTLAAWTDRHRTDPLNSNSIVTTEMIRHLDSFGGVQDYDMGIELVTGLFLGSFRANTSFVLGPNNIAFGRGIGTVAFDVTTGAKLWNTPFDFPQTRTDLIAATLSQTLIATELTAPFSAIASDLKLFDPFGASNKLFLDTPVDGISYFDQNRFLTLTSSGEGALLWGSQSLTTDPNGEWNFAEGGRALNQRAPAPAHPVNFRLLDSQDVGSPVIAFLAETYGWDSSTGKPADLRNCKVREHVTYPSDAGKNQPCFSDPTKRCFFPPSPPWPQKSVHSEYPNPTEPSGSALSTIPNSNPPQLGVSDQQNIGTDINFIKPYSNSSFTATQIFEYSCGTIDKWIKFGGPFTITRTLQQNAQSQWVITISKTGVPQTSTGILKVQ